ncbi:MAG: vWA domain-containing protein [Bryobacteraceae bacterium]
MSMLLKRKDRGVALIVGTAALVMIIPAVGLAIDVGYVYAVKAKLQAAVDGAALAAARGLSLGQTTQAQAASAKQNAVNWFYSNLPPNDWATKNTQMDTSNQHVLVYDDPTNPQVRNVTVTAETSAPTWFMRWFGKDASVIRATSNAARRDVVAMLVLDRSGSMGGSCSALIDAAKQFTGQFAAGRDQIGLVTFSDGVAPVIAPSTSFQTTLGYINAMGSGTGALDTIKCNGSTSTAEAVSLGYNELYKKSLPGALNLVVVETDGLPNTAVYNWWDGASYGISATSACKDANNKTRAAGGWATASSGRQWFGGQNLSSGGSSFIPNISAGTTGSVSTSDPPARTMTVLRNPIQTSHATSNNTVNITSTAPGCTFAGGTSSSIADFAWMPSADVYGNAINPTSAYAPVTTTNGKIAVTRNTNTDWTNIHNAALNVTDNAAYRARTNPTLPVYVFTIGFSNAVDNVLLQRMANDPGWLTSPDCVNSGACSNYADQPQGRYVHAANTQELMQAFLSLSSEVLRLSR